MSNPTHDAIKNTVTTNDVVLFMKGTAQMPQCGFSSRVAGVLNYMGVQFKDVNVLADADTVCQLHLGLARGAAEAVGGIEVDALEPRDPRTAHCRLRCRRVDPLVSGPPAR